MKTTEISGINLTITEDKLFNSLPILTDEHSAKYIYLSYENEYYIKEDMLESIEDITENSFDAIVDGASIGSIYYVAYNI